MRRRGGGGRGGRGGRGTSSTTNSNPQSVGSVDTNTNDIIGTFERRGRKMKSRTELKMPSRSGKIVLEPGDDNQFGYSNYEPKKAYTYPAQLGVILKKEYPGLVEERDDDGNITNVRAATCWNDYYLCPDDNGVTHADRVKREFRHLFEVTDNHQVKANIVLEEYAMKHVPDMMYSARVDAVKEYCRKQGEKVDEVLARAKVLEHHQYMEGKVWWCSEEAWPYLCTWWCSNEYKGKRKRGQAARLTSTDVAQNRGGSRNFTETKQLLWSNKQRKTQETLASASAEHPDDWDQRPFDPSILYDINGGLPHGRLPMGGGFISKDAVKSVARSNKMKPSNSTSHRAVLRENQELRQKQENMERENEKLRRNQALLMLYEKNNMTPPPESLDEVIYHEFFVVFNKRHVPQKTCPQISKKVHMQIWIGKCWYTDSCYIHLVGDTKFALG